MFRTIFGEDESFIEDFIEFLDGVVRRNILADKKEEEKKCDGKCCGDAKEHEHTHYYRNEEKRVDGELVEKREEEWKDGKCLKNEAYRKEDTPKISRGHCSEPKNKTDGGVEYTIELDDNVDVEDPRIDGYRKKNELLRNSVNQLCSDAEEDHKKLRALSQENAILRSEIDELKKSHRQSEETLLEHIDKIEKELAEKTKIVDVFRKFITDNNFDNILNNPEDKHDE